ncbi:MAG: anhydro-N-acetylmuramic acid kinase [Gemmataceae bacterium]
MATRWVIGLASGSSADGVDASLLAVDGVGLALQARVEHWVHQGFGRELRELILRVGQPGQCEIKQVSVLHRLLGEAFAAAARQVADRAGFNLYKVQCVGCAGHTLWHETEGRFPSTLAAGMQAIVAERTGLSTVGDFRSRDLAAGGQGAPLVALADYLLLGDAQENRVLLHLGGLARIVYLPASGRVQDLAGFEPGPCNLLIDGLMRQLSNGREEFDSGGKHAVQGRCHEQLLNSWLNHPYFDRHPPKSCPRHAFGADFVQEALRQARVRQVNVYDLLCSATHFVARTIIEGLDRFLLRGRKLDRILLSGGGTRNGLLLHLLSQRFSQIPMEKTDVHGVAAEARKSAAFALLAALTLDGVPANAPSATGATGSRLLGCLTPGSAANWAACVEWMAGQTAPVASAWR